MNIGTLSIYIYFFSWLSMQSGIFSVVSSGDQQHQQQSSQFHLRDPVSPRSTSSVGGQSHASLFHNSNTIGGANSSSLVVVTKSKNKEKVMCNTHTHTWKVCMALHV